MTALAVIKHFDILKDAGFGLLYGLVVFEIYQFGFQGVEKGLGDSVVITIALTAHAGLNTPGATRRVPQLDNPKCCMRRG